MLSPLAGTILLIKTGLPLPQSPLHSVTSDVVSPVSSLGSQGFPSSILSIPSPQSAFVSPVTLKSPASISLLSQALISPATGERESAIEQLNTLASHPVALAHLCVSTGDRRNLAVEQIAGQHMQTTGLEPCCALPLPKKSSPTTNIEGGEVRRVRRRKPPQAGNSSAIIDVVSSQKSSTRQLSPKLQSSPAKKDSQQEATAVKMDDAIDRRKNSLANSTQSSNGSDADSDVCKVCGDAANGYNFNVITCESCKAFFRRNAKKKKEFICSFDGNCRIDKTTRRGCQRCRLLKCYLAGMKKEWILTDEQLRKRRNSRLRTPTSSLQLSSPRQEHRAGACSRVRGVESLESPQARSYCSLSTEAFSVSPECMDRVGCSSTHEDSYEGLASSGSIPYLDSSVATNSTTPMDVCEPPDRSEDSELQTPRPRSATICVPQPTNQFVHSSGYSVGTLESPYAVGPQSGVASAQTPLQQWQSSSSDYGSTMGSDFWGGDAHQHFIGSRVETYLNECYMPYSWESHPVAMSDASWISEYPYYDYVVMNNITPVDYALSEEEQEELKRVAGAYAYMETNEDAKVMAGVWKAMNKDEHSPADILNIIEFTIRKIVQMAKNIPYFHNLSMETKIQLLRESMIALLTIRGVTRLNAANKAFISPCLFGTRSIDIGNLFAKLGAPDQESLLRRFYGVLNEAARTDKTVIELLGVVVVFKEYGGVLDYAERELCKNYYESYMSLLKRYLGSVHYAHASEMMESVMSALELLPKLSTRAATLFVNKVKEEPVNIVTLEFFKTEPQGVEGVTN